MESCNAVAVAANGSSSLNLNSKKVATHSHLKGLGLNELGRADLIASGFVGQSKAREVRIDNNHLYIL